MVDTKVQLSWSRRPWLNAGCSRCMLFELRIVCEGERTMSKHLESLYQNLVNGKLPHNLSWAEAVELVEHLGEVQPRGDDEFVFRVGSQRTFFKKPHSHHLLIHRKEAHYRGERVPEEDSFYEEVAKDITPANEIVLIGHATGKSNAAEFLKEYLKTHHPDISGRVIATESADLSAVTEPEIEALAKRHMIAA